MLCISTLLISILERFVNSTKTAPVTSRLAKSGGQCKIFVAAIVQFGPFPTNRNVPCRQRETTMLFLGLHMVRSFATLDTGHHLQRGTRAIVYTRAAAVLEMLPGYRVSSSKI